MKNELTRVQKDRSTKRKSDMKNEFDILNLSLTNKTCTKLKFIFLMLFENSGLDRDRTLHMHEV